MLWPQLLTWLVVAGGAWLGWQLLRQNGRILLRLDEQENRLNELEFGESNQEQKSEDGEQTNGEGDGRAGRFSNHSLGRSRIRRDGLKTGTVAPDFRLPRLDGHGELALSDLRGQRVLLVFSSPSCGPCNALAPQLEEFHRKHTRVKVLMISKGEPKENRAKVKEFGLTFPIVLQQQWEISRRYAMFATPIAYLIDEAGVTANDVAVGGEAILQLMFNTERPAHAY